MCYIFSVLKLHPTNVDLLQSWYKDENFDRCYEWKNFNSFIFAWLSVNISPSANIFHKQNSDDVTTRLLLLMTSLGVFTAARLSWRRRQVRCGITEAQTKLQIRPIYNLGAWWAPIDLRLGPKPDFGEFVEIRQRHFSANSQKPIRQSSRHFFLLLKIFFYFLTIHRVIVLCN